MGITYYVLGTLIGASRAWLTPDSQTASRLQGLFGLLGSSADQLLPNA
jgi:hypothetical protein